MSNPQISLRTATLADVPVLQSWESLPHVIDSSPNETIDWKFELEHAGSWVQHLIADLDDVPIGIIQIIDPYEEPSHYWGEVEQNLRAIDIWIGPAEYLGKGHGTVMMRQAIELCFANPEVTAILIDPLATNTRAIKFYRTLGFGEVGLRWFDEDHCLVMRLERDK